MTNSQNTKIFSVLKKYPLAITLSIAFIYQIVNTLQGFDLSDEGWAMYFYQQIFRHPEVVVSQMPYWFTGIVGGLIYNLIPQMGFWGMRVVGVVMVSLTLLLTYRLLYKSMSKRFVIWGLFIQTIIVAGDPKPFGYNSLSTFLALATICLILIGLQKDKLYPVLLAGIVAGLNVFVRLPNILIFLFILIIPAWYYLNNKKNAIFNFKNLLFTFGFGAGIALAIIIMQQLGHWPYFLQSLSSTVDSASDKTNSHQMGAMIFRYLKNYRGIEETGLLFAGVGLLYYLILKIFTNQRIVRIISSIITVVALAWILIHFSNFLRNKDMYLIHFICLSGIVTILFRIKKESEELVILAFCSLLMITLLPCGSDLGIQTYWASSWVALPLAISFFFQRGLAIIEANVKNDITNETRIKLAGSAIKINIRYAISFLYCMLISLTIAGLYQNYSKLYFDPGSRSDKCYSINNSYCRNIYSSEIRAKVLNELLPALSNYVKKDDYLMAYNFIPGINYMTETLSYTPNAWIWCYSPSEYERQINISISQKKPLPVIVRQNFIATNNWSGYIPNFYTTKTKDDLLIKYQSAIVLNRFISQYNYKLVWTNKYFEILLPNVNQIKK